MAEDHFSLVVAWIRRCISDIGCSWVGSDDKTLTDKFELSVDQLDVMRYCMRVERQPASERILPLEDWNAVRRVLLKMIAGLALNGFEPRHPRASFVVAVAQRLRDRLQFNENDLFCFWCLFKATEVDASTIDITLRDPEFRIVGDSGFIGAS
jgi:hypothetical protein